MEKLAFHFICAASEQGQTTVSAQIRHQDGTRLIDFLEPRTATLPKSDVVHFTLSAVGLTFPKFGTYEVVLITDGAEHFRASFNIEQGTPEEFKI
jgi:hypothetical protein